MKIKKLITVRNLLLAFVILFLILALILPSAPAFVLEDSYRITFSPAYAIIFGGTIDLTANNITRILRGLSCAPIALIAWLFLLLSFISSVAIIFPQIKNKGVAFIISGALSLIAGILMFCTLSEGVRVCLDATIAEQGLTPTASEYQAELKRTIGLSTLGGGFIATGIFSLLSAILCFATAGLVFKGKDKALIKEKGPSESQPAQTTNNKDEAEKLALLKEYKALLDSGVITQEEFDEKKKKLLE